MIMSKKSEEHNKYLFKWLLENYDDIANVSERELFVILKHYGFNTTDMWKILRLLYSEEFKRAWIEKTERGNNYD
jgi:hypothetical protein